MQKIYGRRGALVGLLATSLVGVLTVTSVSAARHRVHNVRYHAHYAVRHATYYASSGGYEDSLAGITIGSPVTVVLHRFGNPDEVQLERILLETAGGTGGGGASGGMGSYGAASTKTIPVKIFIGPSSPAPTGGNGGASGGSESNPGSSGMGGGGLSGALGALGVGSLFQEYGGEPGMGEPGMGGGSPGEGGAASGPTAGTLITPDHPEAKYIYDEPYADSLSFVLSPTGDVEQIQATGYQGFVRTRRGVELGEKFSQVELVYGYPEKMDYTGTANNILTADYTNRAHCSFQFYNNRLVGITVAQVD